MNIQTCFVKFLCALCFTFITGFSYASENVERIESIVTAPVAVDIVLLCPEGSQHEGELVPRWVTNDEATEFFCNDSTEETEVGE